MRIVVLILVLAVAMPAADRTAMLERMVSAELGAPVRVRMDDKTTVTGRLLRVENDALRLQVAAAGAITVRDLPIQRVASFRVLRESEFGKEFRRGAGGALGVAGVLIGIGFLIGLLNN